MRLSKFYLPTLKETPAEAEVVSHKLLLRAGMIRKLTAGIYSYLPAGLRTLNKISQIVREEMDNAGALEILMPTVQPADLWKETGRWDFYGKELLRMKDRHDRDYCLGPTHEEVVTDLLRREVRSYKQMPLNVYQIQTKFRDEIRPRFGLMRGREFLMKDAYSFDINEEGADKSYKAMYDAYMAIFTRLGLDFRPVEADSGSIGGSFSHEFMIIADTGEDTIAICENCTYAANLEKAEVVYAKKECVKKEVTQTEEVLTPDTHTIAELCTFLECAPEKTIKTLLFNVDGEAVAALIRGDRELNEIKLKNFLNATELEFANKAEVETWTNAPTGFAGPKNLSVSKIIADNELLLDTDYITGANKKDTHLLHIDLERDCTITAYTDLRVITEDDSCPRCGGAISLKKGIEAGHVFKLGTKYSKCMNAAYLDENGKEQTIIMGCYGIGISRLIAASIEQNHDEHGIIFPPQIAPFEIALLNLTPKDEKTSEKAEEIYTLLQGLGIEVLYDDTTERAGVKFNNADLLGLPMQILVGAKSLDNGIIEVKNRKTGEKNELKIDNLRENILNWRDTVILSWKKS